MNPGWTVRYYSDCENKFMRVGTHETLAMTEELNFYFDYNQEYRFLTEKVSARVYHFGRDKVDLCGELEIKVFDSEQWVCFKFDSIECYEYECKIKMLEMAISEIEYCRKLLEEVFRVAEDRINAGNNEPFPVIIGSKKILTFKSAEDISYQSIRTLSKLADYEQILRKEIATRS